MSKTKTISKVDLFLGQYTSPYTISNYKGGLKKFFGLFSHAETLEERCNEYFTCSREYKEDIRYFYGAEVKNRPPKSAKLLMSTIKTFFAEGADIEFKESFWRSFTRKIGSSRAKTKDRAPTKEEFVEIISHMTAQGRAFFLTLLSSGMRIGESHVFTSTTLL